MKRKVFYSLCLMMSFVGASQHLVAQHQHHSRVTAPKIFLDKSPRVVEYQLSRLSNEQLQMIQTDHQDPKFMPVFSAILLREGMDKASRVAALDGLVAINNSSRAEQLAKSLIALKNKDGGYQRIVQSLGELFIDSLPSPLDSSQRTVMELVQSDGLVAQIGYAGLASRDVQAAKSTALERQQVDILLRAVPRIPQAVKREPFRQLALEQLKSSEASKELLQAALSAVASLPQDNPIIVNSTFAEIATLIQQKEIQVDVLRTLLIIAPDKPSAELARTLCDWIVTHAEQTSPSDRTTDDFLDAIQLAERLLPAIDSDLLSVTNSLNESKTTAKAYRERLKQTTVRVIRIKTVEEQMRYDTPFFAVQAGSDIQIVLNNVDIMPHNLVITQPGALKEIALLSAEAGPEIGPSGKPFVAKDDRVLFASSMIPAFEQERMTLRAPAEPGEYPYVCTFPGHWMRMYGVMVVVDDLDAWLQSPAPPRDPLGNNRQFVNSWTTDNFSENLESDLRGRNPDLGKRLFIEATCSQCHRAGEDLQQGVIGPDLAQTLVRWKGDRSRVIREIVDPSYHIDPAYAMHVVLTDSGTTLSGILVNEDEKSISLLESVQAKTPTVVERTSIETHQKSSNSMMPKGLLDQYSRDEVLEILAFILSIQKPE